MCKSSVYCEQRIELEQHKNKGTYKVHGNVVTCGESCGTPNMQEKSEGGWGRLSPSSCLLCAIGVPTHHATKANLQADDIEKKSGKETPQQQSLQTFKVRFTTSNSQKEYPKSDYFPIVYIVHSSI